MKTICVIGQLPPPVHGLSKALDVLINAKELNNKYTIKAIDIKNNKKFLNNYRAIKENNADLYYFTISQTIFGNIRDMIILYSLLNKKKNKVIIHYHGGYYKELFSKMSFIQRYINVKLISQINRLIVLSPSLKSIFLDIKNFNRFSVCENFIESQSLINDNEFCNKIKSVDNKKEINVLYLSNFIKTKGYLDVLESAVINNNHNVKFHFAGHFFNEEDQKKFFQYINDRDLVGKVYYHGIVKEDQKKLLLLNSDIFVLPTYYPKEGQPISIIEAMGNGLAVITTKHAGIPDIISKENGIYVNSKSPIEISSAIDYLVQNRKILKNIALKNREDVLKLYKESDYIKRLDTIFSEVIKEND